MPKLPKSVIKQGFEDVRTAREKQEDEIFAFDVAMGQGLSLASKQRLQRKIDALDKMSKKEMKKAKRYRMLGAASKTMRELFNLE